MGITGWGGSVTLYVEIDLSQAVEDLGSVAVGSDSLWDVAVWDSQTWKDGITWTDVSEWVLGVETTRAFSRELTAYNAGNLRLTLDNTDGRFSPDNTSSPYRVGASTAIGMCRPIRVRATYGSFEWSIFVGRLDSWSERYTGPGRAVVEVAAVDAFAELGAFDSYQQTSQGSGELFGARLGRILDNAGFKGERRIDAGTNTMQATTLASNALTELKLTADSEGGSCWIGGDGIFYADAQNALIEKERSNTVQVTFTNSDSSTAVGYAIDSVQPEYDGTQVENMAAYARVGSTVQTAVAAASRALYGDRQDERTDLVCETDTQVLTLARRQVALKSDPERRIEQLTFSPMLQPSTAQIDLAWNAIARGLLALRSLCRVLHTTPAGFEIDKSVFVRGISHSITPTTWTVNLMFSSATVWQMYASSLWDAAVWDTDVWSW